MQETLAITLASMHHDMAQLNNIALNLANVSTPGYKRDVIAVRPFDQVLDAAGFSQVQGTDINNAITDGSAFESLSNIQRLTDMHPGTMKLTGQPLDLAIASDGFFEVTTQNGPAYTRQGNFHLDPRGRLVTAQGYPVAGQNGDIYLTTQTPVIDPRGVITEPNATTGPSATDPGVPVAQLKIMRFDNPKTLERIGDGLMIAAAATTQDATSSVANNSDLMVRQGVLENSNVSSMQEMMHLIQTMRHFESMQKIAQGYDEMLGTAIRKLGDLS